MKKSELMPLDAKLKDFSVTWIGGSEIALVGGYGYYFEDNKAKTHANVYV